MNTITIKELDLIAPHPLGNRARCVNCTCGNNMYKCRSNRHIPENAEDLVKQLRANTITMNTPTEPSGTPGSDETFKHLPVDNTHAIRILFAKCKEFEVRTLGAEMELEDTQATISLQKEERDQLTAKLAEQQKEIEELRKDKARLDWLETTTCASGYHTELRGLSIAQSNAVIISTGCGSGPFQRNTKGQSGPNPLRQAIDSAIEGK